MWAELLCDFCALCARDVAVRCYGFGAVGCVVLPTT